MRNHAKGERITKQMEDAGDIGTMIMTVFLVHTTGTVKSETQRPFFRTDGAWPELDTVKVLFQHGGAVPLKKAVVEPEKGTAIMPGYSSRDLAQLPSTTQDTSHIRILLMEHHDIKTSKRELVHELTPKGDERIIAFLDTLAVTNKKCTPWAIVSVPAPSWMERWSSHPIRADSPTSEYEILPVDDSSVES